MGIIEPSEGMEAINQALWKKHRGETPEHALRYFRQTHAELMAALGKLSDADLPKLRLD